jgi:hypothetical protein
VLPLHALHAVAVAELDLVLEPVQVADVQTSNVLRLLGLGGPSEPLGACVLHAKEDAGSDGGSKS